MDENWSADGTEALKLRLVRSIQDAAALEEEEEEVLVKDFDAAFVYPIFGQEETIFGYKNLEIQFRFASGSLNQYLHVEYESKFPEAGDVKADDPEQTLYEFIPPAYAKQWPDFLKTVEKDALEFKPLGTKIGAFREQDDQEVNGKGKGKGKSTSMSCPPRPWEILPEGDAAEDDEVIFEAYSSNWETPGFKEYHRRMQIFVLLYIEGAQYIDEEDSRWEFVTLFERRKRGSEYSYHFVGYVSFYSFFCWPDTKRLRLAQFVMLPPYQGQGYGSALYTICYRNVLSRPEISELTVEDPSELFEDLRDKSDLHTLIAAKALEGTTAPFDKTVTEVIRKKFKIADRQFYRLLEMILLLKLDPNDEAASRSYRLAVKRRLFLFNKEQLSQLEEQEKKDKLQETFESVIDSYRRLTEKFAV